MTKKEVKLAIAGIKISIAAIAIALALQALTVIIDFIQIPFWKTFSQVVVIFYCIISATILLIKVNKIK